MVLKDWYSELIYVERFYMHMVYLVIGDFMTIWMMPQGKLHYGIMFRLVDIKWTI